MKRRRAIFLERPLPKLNNLSLAIISIGLLYLKITSYAVLTSVDLNLFGGGNDSNYYHMYAIGQVSNAVNFWPVILRFLNDNGFYNREIISYFIFSLNLFAIPYLVHRISLIFDAGGRQRNLLTSYVIVSIYPTLFFFSLDIYRDLVMVFIFLMSLVFFKQALRLDVFSFFSFGAFLFLCYLAYLFRPYLGFSMFLSSALLLIYYQFSKFTKIWLLAYVIGITAAYSIGIFDALTQYRGVDGFSDGGSTLGIGLQGRDPITFLILYLYSFIAQVFGLYLVNISTLLVFFAEAVPFLLFFLFVIKNRSFMNLLCHYLIIFFVIYTTIWVVGNDNLGTAVRLRIPSYLSIFICYLIIKQRKIFFIRPAQALK